MKRFSQKSRKCIDSCVCAINFFPTLIVFVFYLWPDLLGYWLSNVFIKQFKILCFDFDGYYDIRWVIICNVKIFYSAQGKVRYRSSWHSFVGDLFYSRLLLADDHNEDDINQHSISLKAWCVLLQSCSPLFRSFLSLATCLHIVDTTFFFNVICSSLGLSASSSSACARFPL